MRARAKVPEHERSISDLHDRQVKHACFAFGLLIFIGVVVTLASFSFQEMIAESAIVAQPTITLR